MAVVDETVSLVEVQRAPGDDAARRAQKQYGWELADSNSAAAEPGAAGLRTEVDTRGVQVGSAEPVASVASDVASSQAAEARALASVVVAVGNGASVVRAPAGEQEGEPVVVRNVGPDSALVKARVPA